MLKLHAQRLWKLANFIETVPDKNFDINTYGTKTSCGTVACIAGWAAMMPEFQELGLKLEFHQEYPTEGSVRFEGRYGPGAIAFAQVFGPETLDENLCYPEGHENSYDTTPKQAAERIREMVGGYGWTPENLLVAEQPEGVAP